MGEGQRKRGYALEEEREQWSWGASRLLSGELIADWGRRQWRRVVATANEAAAPCVDSRRKPWRVLQRSRDLNAREVQASVRGSGRDVAG